MLPGFQNFLNLLDRSENVLIISHSKPDADTLGAAIALCLWIESFVKDVDLACIDKPGKEFAFLSKVDDFKDSFNLTDYQLMIVVDCGASHLTDFDSKYPGFLNSSVPVVNIDHHSSNDNFGDINIVDPLAASTTLLLYRFFKEIDVSVNVSMATALLAGIYGDTGGFMHSNTSAEVMAAAADLMTLGADVKSITSSLFATKTVPALKLWGKALENTVVTDENIVLSVLKEQDYEEAGAEPDQLTGLVDYLNMVPNSRYAVLINEDRQGNVKGSFRTRNDDVNLSQIASNYGGGGHAKAAGFKLPGRLSADNNFKIVSEEEVTGLDF